VSGPRIGSLFSGYGGIDLGLRELWPDAETVWVSDIEKGPIKVLAHRYPDAPNLGDVTKVDWSTVEPVDIITGGSPCQDLSHAGKRAGMKPGTRSGLWASMCDAIETLRPSLVIWENVRGALSAEAITGDVESCGFCMADRDGQPMRALGRVLGDLADIGYDAAWVGLRAADVGACHGRFRVFVLAWPADAPSVGLEWTRSARAGRHGLADGSGGSLVPTPQAHDAVKGKTAAQVAAMRARGHGVANLNEMVENLLPTPAVNDMGDGKTLEWWDDWAPRQKSSTGAAAPHGKSLAIEAMRAPMLPTPQTSDANGAGDKPGEWADRWQLRDIELAKVRAIWGDYAPAIARHERALGRPAPAHLEPTGKDGAGRLAPRFVEWMMGLPDGWITDVPGITRTEALKLCGNGVVPQQCAEAVRWLLDVRATSEAVAS